MNSLKHLLTAAGAVLVLAGCTTVYDQSTMVMKRAEFDLACTNSFLSVREIAPNAFGAEGCGHRASYVVLCNGFLPSSCTPLLDSERSGIAAAVSLAH